VTETSVRQIVDVLRATAPSARGLSELPINWPVWVALTELGVWVDGETQRVALGWRSLPRWGAIPTQPAVFFSAPLRTPRKSPPNFRSISPARPLRGLEAQSSQRLKPRSDRSLIFSALL
jgi:hypothetical protein